MSSDKKIVSVIIPTFNRLSFLKNTLLCLMNQHTSKKYEVIVVDSGDDTTEEFIKKMSKCNKGTIRYKKIKYCKNRSLLRNIGAKIAQGELLIFLDNDILVLPNFIEKIINLYCNNEKVVVLGKRNSLTEFDVNLFGKENLINNVDELFNLPAICDDRDLYLDDIDLTTETAEKPWRFLFSHSFCVSKKIFFEVGGFDKGFGNRWGCEDIELGFRLYNCHCKFVLSNEIISFHQPHFSQSLKEQKESFTNNDLFINKHPYADVELNLSLYNFFQKDYLELKSIKQEFDFDYVHKIMNYSFILGCIKDINDNKKLPKKCLLGTHIPFYKKCKKIFVLKTIYRMNDRIKFAIISEAFRVSDCVCFEKEQNKNQSKKNLLYLYEKFDQLGFDVITKEDNDCYKFELKKRIKKKFLALFLCDVSCYEKRLVYLFLAKKFRENNWKVNIVDLRRKENEKGEDLILDETNKSFEEYCYINEASVISSMNNKVEKLYYPLSGKDNFVIDDVDFPYSIHEQNLFPETTYICKSVFDMFAINAAFEKVNEYRKEKKDDIKKEFDFCAFMLTGFYEDGIDVALKILKDNKNKTSKIAIKIPNYDLLPMECYPRHNEYSRKYKCSYLLDKKRKEENLLKATVMDMGLIKRVEIIKETMTVFDAFEFMMKGKTFLSLNRGLSAHFLIYSSIFLNQKPIVTEHSIFDERFKNYCLCVKTSKSSYAKEKKLSDSNENIMRIAQKIDINSFEKILEKKSDGIDINNYDGELSKIQKEYFTKMNNFIINF